MNVTLCQFLMLVKESQDFVGRTYELLRLQARRLCYKILTTHGSWLP